MAALFTIAIAAALFTIPSAAVLLTIPIMAFTILITVIIDMENKEWEEAKKVQQGRATQNKYPHRMSHLGYVGLEAKIEKDEGRCGTD
ncbi:hypothetical protein PanWU01x14_311200 [Parasponia andersonii]|uniref:Uncharacterized protein n=1 Tax=Parasponia andersonii TaxID=3476 RepID=A0A2P5APX5_PARAD|nr:hypothetical protein PanWU01x14_311200 [Parasponia andersonii]